MARNEEKHRAELAGRRTALFGQAPSTVRREMLFDVEAPEYAEARVFMTAHDALTTALRSEEKAWTFFSQALPSIKQPEVKALFEELLQEEVEHQVLVKVELSKLPPEDSYKQEDFEDDPVGHD
jgi:rubrerythrin